MFGQANPWHPRVNAPRRSGKIVTVGFVEKREEIIGGHARKFVEPEALVNLKTAITQVAGLKAEVAGLKAQVERLRAQIDRLEALRGDP